MEEKNNQLIKLDTNRILEIINTSQNLTSDDKNQLSKQIASGDVELRRIALEKLTQSDLAQKDLFAMQSEIAALNKKGVYFKSKQTIKTGSGNVEIEMKGGDTKLIIPVLVIAGVVIIVVLWIVFGKK